MGLHWAACKQTSTSDSTTVSELDSMHHTLKCDGLPLASLLEFLLGRDVNVEVMEDNTTAIIAAKAGYSPKLRYLHRSRRIDLEWLAEVFEDPRNSCIYTASDKQKGDLMTKEFNKPEFEARKKLLGIGAITLSQKAGVTRYVCSGGILALVAHGDTRFPGVEKPGVDSWVLDTGSGHHLVSAATLDPASRGILRKAETR